MPLVELDDLVGADIGREAADRGDDQTEEDDAEDLKYEEEAAAGIGVGVEVTEADC